MTTDVTYIARIWA